MKLSTCLHQFLDQYLPRIKGSSEHTIKAYRDTFKLFLLFAANYHHIKIDSLCLDHLSCELILDFLNYLESQQNSSVQTRNHRLAVLKSFAKMIRFTGARASEIATLKLDYFDYQNKTLAILGKGNRYRLIKLCPKTVELLKLYISKYRKTPKPFYRHRLFINQRGEELTRHGIYRLCKKYLFMTLPPKRLKDINPAHSFRHSCAVNMLASGSSTSEIKIHLGHENAQSTMLYLHMDLSCKREVQKKFIEYTQSILAHDPKIEELIDWENKEETLKWLDSL